MRGLPVRSSMRADGAASPAARMTNAVTTMASAVLITTDATTANTSPLSDCTDTMMPTPAGTNRSDRCRKISSAVPSSGATAFGRTVRYASKSSMPTTGPGTGSFSKYEMPSPKH